MNLQDIIHYLEVGAGKRFLRFLVPCIVVLAIVFLYDIRTWKNLSAPDAMDAAQLARNIADGKGYTTLFIRPLSIYLVQARNQGKGGTGTGSSDQADYARLKTAHPDLANAPIYPLALAGLMKIAPFQYAVNLKSGFWATGGKFARYQPDFFITVFNQLIFIVILVAAYFIAKKLFDASIASLAAILILGCNLLWRFSASGLSTMLLMLGFLLLCWCVLKTEELAREEEPDGLRIACWSIGAGLLTGAGALTRYAFGWLIIPLLLFLILFSGPKKVLNAVAAFAAFAIALSPWIARNVAVSGTPFGTAGFAIFDGMNLMPMALERSLHPNLLALGPGLYCHKFATNAVPILENELLKIGGTWPSLLFFSGLLLAFNRPGAKRIRYFLLMCLAVFIVIQALGRTSLSDLSPEVNSENLLVIMAPMVIIFGTAFFFILLDQMTLHAVELRYVVMGVFVLLSYLPLISALWYKPPSPVSYPPNYPPDIERIGGWMKESELTMSDVPWAVAWYGNRQCVWWTGDLDSFFEINDYIKPVNALYLTMQAMDFKLVSDCFRGGDNSWGKFVLNVLTNKPIPPSFPLHHGPAGSAAVESGLFLTDMDRWKSGAAPEIQ